MQRKIEKIYPLEVPVKDCNSAVILECGHAALRNVSPARSFETARCKACNLPKLEPEPVQEHEKTSSTSDAMLMELSRSLRELSVGFRESLDQVKALGRDMQDIKRKQQELEESVTKPVGMGTLGVPV